MKTDFKQLYEAMDAAHDAMTAALARACPVDSTVEFFRSARQVNASRGTVIGHGKGRQAGYLNVRMLSARASVGYHVACVHWDAIE